MAGASEPADVVLPPLPLVPQPPKRVRRVMVTDSIDVVFALVALVFGWLAWAWLLSGRLYTSPRFTPGLAVPVVLLLAVLTSMSYFGLRGVLVTRAAVGGAVILLVSALPFALFDTTPVHLVMGAGLVLAYLTWHAYVAGVAVSRGLSPLTFFDLVTQLLIVPLGNLGAWLAAFRRIRRGGSKANQPIYIVIGIIVGLPVILVVLLLLTSADTAFGYWIAHIQTTVVQVNGRWMAWQLSTGFVLGFLLFASWYGNFRRWGTFVFTAGGVNAFIHDKHKIAAVAIAAPMLILCLIYAIFLAVTILHLFEAFSTHTLVDYTYSNYARYGFFDLVIVSGINVAVLAFSYLFATRYEGAYPRLLRVIGGAMAVLTLLLIATAASKLMLYTQMFGLTRLRLYTLWFTGVLFVVFILVALWHIKPIRVGTPIVVFVLAAFLGLLWSNSDGIIANYNVNRYLEGVTKSIDVDYLSGSLSAAGVPALIKLGAEANDESVWKPAVTAISQERAREAGPWMSWNWQSARARELAQR